MPVRGASASHLTTIYIVDSSSEQRRRLRDAVACAGAQIVAYASAEEFLAQVPSTAQGCVIAPSDLGGTGIRALIAAMRARGLPLPVIVLGRGDDLPTVVELMRAGAAEYLEPPLSDRRLRAVVGRVVGTGPA
jgi:FixJ family two-component response regulator